MKQLRVAFVFLFAIGSAFGTVIDTTNAGTITAFQTGATVVNFSSLAGVTAQNITTYTNGVAVNNTAKVFNQIAGVQFSVGGVVGTDRPAVYSLGGGIAGDASSPTNVLGPVDFDGNTLFGPGAMIEVFFTTKVDRVGFRLNPALGNVLIIAADTNFAFSGLPETTLESGTVTKGNFVGIQRATADIGGFKIIGLGATGFTIDDFTFKTGSAGGGGGGNTVPEPTSLLLLGTGLTALLGLRRKQ